MIRYLLSLCLLSACVEAKSAPEKQPPQKAIPAQSAAKKNLALESPGGGEPVDQEITTLQKKLEKLPNSADTWELLGRAWVRKSREAQRPELYARAEAAAEEALRLNPKQLGALEVKGLVMQSEHRFQALSALAKEMLAKDEKNPESWALAGDAALELGQYDKSVEAYQQMIDLRPGLPAYSRVAYLRWLVGDIEGSLEMWDEAINVGFNKNAEQIAFCFSEKAQVLWLKGDLTRAQEYVANAQKLMPEYAPALVLQGKLSFARGDLKGAQEALSKAVKVHPTVDAYHWLAAIAAQNQEEATATEARAQSESLGRLGDFRTLSVSLSTNKRDAATALTLAKRDAEQRGGVYTYDALAFAHLRSQDLAEAKTYIDLALSQGTQDPMLFAHAGLIYYALGDTALAKERLQAAIKLNPSFDPVLIKEVNERLASL